MSESPQSSLSHHFPGTFTSLWHDLCAYLTRPRAHPCRLNVSLTRIPDRFLQRRHFSLSGLLIGTFILRCCITAGVWDARARAWTVNCWVAQTVQCSSRVRAVACSNPRKVKPFGWMKILLSYWWSLNLVVWITLMTRSEENTLPSNKAIHRSLVLMLKDPMKY